MAEELSDEEQALLAKHRKAKAASSRKVSPTRPPVRDTAVASVGDTRVTKARVVHGRLWPTYTKSRRN